MESGCPRSHSDGLQWRAVTPANDQRCGSIQGDIEPKGLCIARLVGRVLNANQVRHVNSPRELAYPKRTAGKVFLKCASPSHVELAARATQSSAYAAARYIRRGLTGSGRARRLGTSDERRAALLIKNSRWSSVRSERRSAPTPWRQAGRNTRVRAESGRRDKP